MKDSTRTSAVKWAGVAVTLLGAIALGAGCEGGDPVSSTGVGGGNGGSGGGAAPCNADTQITPQDGMGCTPLADDYTPRDAASANDTWAACISDDNAYHPFDPNISTAARVAAFEDIAKLLAFGGGRAPSPQDFLDARVAYTLEQGIESRVSRREDPHYPAAPKECRDLTPAEQQQYPERCVGPVKIQPIINKAFEEGIAGKDPIANAARIEAALLWFFYISSYKESLSCAETQADCDSSYAYYNGDKPRADGLGLARYVRARSPEAHDRIWDGILAVRCWRDLDNPTGAAMDTALQDRASAQLDRALLRGVAMIVRQRLQQATCGATWEGLEILGPVLDREATARDAAKALILRDAFSKADPASVDVDATIAAIDAIFPCP